MKRVTGSIVLVFAAASFSAAAVNVDVNTPNASVHVGTLRPERQVTVIERERVVVQEHRHDNGKHKGEYKHKKDRRDERDEHHRGHK